LLINKIANENRIIPVVVAAKFKDFSLRSGHFDGTLLYVVTSRLASAAKMRGKTSV